MIILAVYITRNWLEHYSLTRKEISSISGRTTANNQTYLVTGVQKIQVTNLKNEVAEYNKNRKSRPKKNDPIIFLVNLQMMRNKTTTWTKLKLGTKLTKYQGN